MIRSIMTSLGVALAGAAAWAFLWLDEPFYGSDSESAIIALLLFTAGTALVHVASRPALTGLAKLVWAWTDMKRREIQDRTEELNAKARTRGQQ